MSTILESVNKQISEEFPTFRVIPKSSSSLMKAIDFFLKVVTFGQMKLFMTAFLTTIGTTVYVPSTWDTLPQFSKAAALRHERVHMRQARKYTNVLFKFLYLFVFLPMGLSYFRMKFEKEAYEESIRAHNQYGIDITNPVFKELMVQNFVSSAYGWMWPFRKSIENWYDTVSQAILKE